MTQQQAIAVLLSRQRYDIRSVRAVHDGALATLQRVGLDGVVNYYGSYNVSGANVSYGVLDEWKSLWLAAPEELLSATGLKPGGVMVLLSLAGPPPDDFPCVVEGVHIIVLEPKAAGTGEPQ